MIEINILKRLLEKYSFIESIPEKAQKFIISSRKRVLKSSLSAVDDLGPFYRLVVSVFYNSRLIGLRPSLSLSKSIAISAIIIASALLAAGLILASNEYISKPGPGKPPIVSMNSRTQNQDLKGNDVPVKSMRHDEDSADSRVKIIDSGIINKSTPRGAPAGKMASEKTGEIIDGKTGLLSGKDDAARETYLKKKTTAETTGKSNISGRKSSRPVKARLGIVCLTPSGVKKDEAAEVSKKLYTNLRRLKGKDRILYLSEDRASKNVNHQLLGRLSKVGNTYIMAISIVDSQNGDVLYNKTTTCGNKSAIDNAIKNIADEIDSRTAIWE